MAESENLLQKSAHKLEKITSKYGVTISTNKTRQWLSDDETPLEAR
jgi:hypothetical protein